MRQFDPKYLEFVYIDVQESLHDLERQGRLREVVVTSTHLKTEIQFIKQNELLTENASAWRAQFEHVVIRYKDFVPIGLNFLMFGGVSSWLKNCDRKSNDLLKKGVREEERLAVYSDIFSLQKRFDKFIVQERCQMN
jgi:hypothetical protein